MQNHQSFGEQGLPVEIIRKYSYELAHTLDIFLVECNPILITVL